MTKPAYWNCHEHREELHVADYLTYSIVYHKEKGVLCQQVRQHGVKINLYIRFNTDNARNWIKYGTIGELQERLTNLQVGFFLETIQVEAGWLNWPLDRKLEQLRQATVALLKPASFLRDIIKEYGSSPKTRKLLKVEMALDTFVDALEEAERLPDYE